MKLCPLSSVFRPSVLRFAVLCLLATGLRLPAQILPTPSYVPVTAASDGTLRTPSTLWTANAALITTALGLSASDSPTFAGLSLGSITDPSATYPLAYYDSGWNIGAPGAPVSSILASTLSVAGDAVGVTPDGALYARPFAVFDNGNFTIGTPVGSYTDGAAYVRGGSYYGDGSNLQNISYAASAGSANYATTAGNGFSTDTDISWNIVTGEFTHIAVGSGAQALVSLLTNIDNLLGGGGGSFSIAGASDFSSYFDGSGYPYTAEFANGTNNANYAGYAGYANNSCDVGQFFGASDWSQLYINGVHPFYADGSPAIGASSGSIAGASDYSTYFNSYGAALQAVTCDSAYTAVSVISPNSLAPAATDGGTAGQMVFTDTYTYRCFANGDWRRVAVTYSTY